MINWKIYEGTPTVELIELIKMKENSAHLDNASAAFHAFCFRFQQCVNKKVEFICKNNGYDNEFAMEVIDRTFQKFWKYPQFKLEKMKVSNPEKGVELYLLRIAQNCFYDLINERNGINISPYNGNETIIYEIPTPEEIIPISNENFIILKEVLGTLTWKHRVVYLTYLQYENEGYKLPRKLLCELRDKLEIKQDTIRSYKNEVINKIKEYKKIWNQKRKILN